MQIYATAPLLIPEPLSSSRTLHLVDVENLAGGPSVEPWLARAICASYEVVAPTGYGDHIIVATSHFAAPVAWFAWPPEARRLVRSGVDGADWALLEVLERENVAARFAHVVIGSGDGIFAMAAARLQSAGCAVTVVARRRALSRQLRLAVRDVRYLDVPPARVVALRAA